MVPDIREIVPSLFEAVRHCDTAEGLIGMALRADVERLGVPKVSPGGKSEVVGDAGSAASRYRTYMF